MDSAQEMRRWFQFSIRSLVLLTVAAAAVWWGCIRWPVEEEPLISAAGSIFNRGRADEVDAMTYFLTPISRPPNVSEVAVRAAWAALALLGLSAAAAFWNSRRPAAP